MPKTDKKVETTSEPKQESTDETTIAPEQVAINSEARNLAEESFNEDNLAGTVEEEDGDASESLEDSSTDETSEDNEPLEGDDTSEDSEVTDSAGLEEFLADDTETQEDDTEKVSGVDKRIDKLTRQSYEKDAKIAELEKKLATPETKTDTKPKYTKDQLAKALSKAREEGDTDLELEIIEHMTESKAQEVENRYKAKEEAIRAKQESSQREWVNITEMFHYNDVELYPGSQTDLNIKDSNSLIYRLASELYQNQGFNGQDSGMTKAVSKALKLILDKKQKSAKPRKSSKEKQLETKVKKLKRKTSSPSGNKSVKAESTTKSTKPKTDADKVYDAVAERKELNAWKQV